MGDTFVRLLMLQSSFALVQASTQPIILIGMSSGDNFEIISGRCDLQQVPRGKGEKPTEVQQQDEE